MEILGAIVLVLIAFGLLGASYIGIVFTLALSASPETKKYMVISGLVTAVIVALTVWCWEYLGVNFGWWPGW